MTRVFILAAMVLALGPFAAAKGPRSALKQACHDDVARFCATAKTGGGQLMKCMKQHHEQLSDTCKKEIEAQKAAHRGRRH
jgi:hypothetical protein